jgi:hypothetical protein
MVASPEAALAEAEVLLMLEQQPQAAQVGAG